jgi:hypothetical protein
MALLDMLNGAQGSQSMGGMDPSSLMQMLQMGRQDPFSRPMPGDGLMGAGNMPSMQSMPGLEQYNPQGGQAPQMPGMNTISTDFANTQPGLPNLPDSFSGFGFGQFAPQEHAGNNTRQQLISRLMEMMPQLSGGMNTGGMGSNGQGFGGF